MKNKFDNFDDFASRYRDIHTENIKITGANSEYYAEYKVKEISNFLNLNNKTILDFGCGDGACYPFFKSYFPECNYVGVDISEESVFKAKQIYPEGNFVVFDGFKIPFDNGSLDFIFSACVFHHIDWTEHVTIFKEMKSKLNLNGTLCIFEHNPWNPITVSIVNKCIFDVDARLINFLQLRNHLRKAGFKSIKTYFTLFFPRSKIFGVLLKIEVFLRKLPFGGQYFILSKKEN